MPRGRAARVEPAPPPEQDHYGEVAWVFEDWVVASAPQYPRTPEARLAEAVLLSAILDYCNGARYRADAERYLFATTPTPTRHWLHPFSFEAVCGLFHLDMDAVRRAIRERPDRFRVRLIRC